MKSVRKVFAVLENLTESNLFKIISFLIKGYIK